MPNAVSFTSYLPKLFVDEGILTAVTTSLLPPNVTTLTPSVLVSYATKEPSFATLTLRPNISRFRSSTLLTPYTPFRLSDISEYFVPSGSHPTLK